MKEEFVTWYFDGGKEPSFIEQNYRDRVTLSGNPSNKDLTITLSDVTMDDNGTYECSVRMRHDLPTKSAQMDLVVLGLPQRIYSV
uniref:Uncharacterized protein n=1 Tax=Sphaerodactylus townsendi TaxID=933632 RepID=A0ACB8FII0_9SAUR